MNKVETLVPGSKCVVYAATSHEEVAKSSGTFQGFVPVGEESSLCIVLDERHGEMAGKIRLIPTNMIVAIDVIEMAHVEDNRETNEDTHYYG